MAKPIISADSHIAEPPDTYTPGIETRFRAQEPADHRISRRQVLKGAVVARVGVLGVSTVRAAEPSAAAPLAPLPAASAGESVLLRMQREVQRALKKPLEHRRWVMAVDMRRCVGCAGCTVNPMIQSRADLNADGAVNAQDLQRLVNTILGV